MKQFTELHKLFHFSIPVYIKSWNKISQSTWIPDDYIVNYSGFIETGDHFSNRNIQISDLSIIVRLFSPSKNFSEGLKNR
ncbi:MAG TPA: hypothetical protein VMW76_01505 [Bacteroidales bacterium]|nr:hypothetical protein [Bacteroidales bacterium]